MFKRSFDFILEAINWIIILWTDMCITIEIILILNFISKSVSYCGWYHKKIILKIWYQMKRQHLHIYLMQLYKNIIIKFVFTGLTLTACLRINKLFNTHKRVVQNTRKISMHFVQGITCILLNTKQVLLLWYLNVIMCMCE